MNISFLMFLGKCKILYNYKCTIASSSLSKILSNITHNASWFWICELYWCSLKVRSIVPGTHNYCNLIFTHCTRPSHTIKSLQLSAVSNGNAVFVMGNMNKCWFDKKWVLYYRKKQTVTDKWRSKDAHKYSLNSKHFIIQWCIMLQYDSSYSKSLIHLPSVKINQWLKKK